MEAAAAPPLDEAAQRTFVGGGEMGARIRAFDWSSTLLGPAGRWPQSLRTAVGMCIDSGFPMLVCWGPELVMLYNDGYIPVLGAKHPAALGRPLLEVWSEIRDMLAPMFGGVVDSGKAVYASDLMFPLGRHGFIEECYFTFSYSPIRDEGGAVGGVLVTCSETTARVIGERRLRTLRDLAAAAAANPTSVEEACRAALPPLVANTHDLPFALLYLYDDDGARARRVAATPAGADARFAPAEVELSRSDDCAWPLAEVYRARQAELVTDLAPRLGAVPAGPWPEAAPAALVLPLWRAGQEHPYGALVAGVSARRALDGDYRDFLGLVAEHITAGIANARAYEDERRRLEALAELDRAKTAFFSNVSHEFRTPLTLMLGPLGDALAGVHGPVPDELRAPITTAQRNSLRLVKLVNSLLDFARIEAGRVDSVFEPVDLATLTADVASSFRSAVERAGLRFVVECAPLAAPVFVDREMWEKIVLNLVSNAFKFTLEGEIAVRLAAVDGAVELEVRDTGCGIAADELPRLFERFHRVQGARARTHEGSGIGLALVQELVKLHGGAIRVASEPGRGSAFCVRIPTGSAHLPPERIGAARALSSTGLGTAPFVEEAVRWLPDADDAPAAAAAAASVPTTATAGARILVADDNADMRRYLARILGAQWTVETVADGAAALEAIGRRPPDLVLSDVMMPGLDGFALLAAVRADERTRALPVVLLSARAGDEARIEGLDAGADDYLTKPFNPRELVARVNAQLAVARARQAAEAQRSAMYELFMQAPAPIVVLRGEELVFEMANPRFLAGGNRAAADVLGRRLDDVYPELGRQGFDAVARQVMRSGEPFTADVAHMRVDLRGDGTLEDRWYTFVCAPLRQADGEPRVMSLSFDMTALMLTQRKVDEAMALLDAVFAAAPVGLAFFDREGRYVRANQALSAMKGKSVAATLGRRPADVLPPELAAYVEAAVRRVFDSGEPSGELELSTPSPPDPGEVRHFIVSYYPVRDAAGAVTHVGEVVIDITERKRIELERAALLDRERLARREADLQKEHLRSLFMQAPMPIAILRGPEHVIELANERVCEAWGRAHDEVIGRPILEALPELVSQPFKQLLDGVLATGRPHLGKETPAHLARPDGSTVTIFFNFVYAPMRGVGGEIEGVLVVAFDVTDEVRARQKLDELRGGAEAANRAKDEFLAMLGHELRNPLAPIVTALQLLKLRGEMKATKEHQVIERQVEHLVRLVDDLLDISRITRGKVELKKEVIELSTVMVKAIEIASPLLEKREHHFIVDVPADGMRLHADPVRLAQVIGNLLTNAAKYTDPGGHVSVRAWRDGHEIVVQVKDDGIGIMPELLPDVFDLFVQGPRSAARSEGGLGIGLSLVRSLVQLHGGTVAALSKGAGQGSEFVVRLPALLQELAAESSRPRRVEPARRGRRVLVVDDNADAAEMLAEVLRSAGHEVAVAHDGPEALAAVARFLPEVALLDIGLPVMDGYELGAKLRSTPALATLQLVAVTGYGQEHDHRRSRQAGFVRHLVKPVDPEGMLAIIDAL